VGCIPGHNAKDPNICDDNGSIEGECNETTTPPPPTTSPAKPEPKQIKIHKKYIIVNC
jgi:hypothetical protein